ncbi:MAG: acetylglutamate kinase [Treponema sp.]|nr:acetylglutamate kinase [Treponema sp.]MCL2237828.1 acetylglutamate kinase [Treponema sp.]
MSDVSISNKDRANTLIHALPYIQNFQNKTIVVKYGGNAMLNDELKKAVIEDIILMSCVGIRTVLVHGGGPEIEAMLKKTGKESRFVNGLRYTDEETMDIVQMVLCGKVNKDITALLQKNGGRAIGLCGIDTGFLKARRIKGDSDLGLVGEIKSVDVSLLNTILNEGIIPVISSVAYGTGDDEGKPLNINADIAAAKIAAAIGAEKLVLMTDVRGILRDVNDETSLIKTVERRNLDSLKNEGIISKGMIPKTDCCAIALDGGVTKAHIIDGRLSHAILIELFTDEGIGTEILTSDP